MSEQHVKPKGVQLQHNNPKQFIELGKRFIKGYYTLSNTKNYKELSELFKVKSVFRIQNKEVIGGANILALKKQLHDKNDIKFIPTQYDVVLSGARRINVMVMGQCQFTNERQVQLVPFTDYVHVCFDQDQQIYIQTSMTMINDGVQRPIIEKGKEFIARYYKCLNSRDFTSLSSILKSFSKFSLQNTILTGNEEICKGLNTMFEKTSMVFSEINFDILSSGPERTNILVTGIATIKHDKKAVNKMFSEFIHVGQKGNKRSKKKKKKQIINEQKNIDTSYWIQATMFQLWK